MIVECTVVQCGAAIQAAVSSGMPAAVTQMLTAKSLCKARYVMLLFMVLFARNASSGAV
jgi:hypothetical protein